MEVPKFGIQIEAHIRETIENTTNGTFRISPQ
jgi:hypothetical protein